MVYAEKIMISKKNQISPMHRHDIKSEDIINRGGGKLVLELFMAKADGSIDCYKARWVAKGYSQRYGINYDDTYAPVVRIEHLRLLLVYVAALSLNVHQLNVVTTFLQADLRELVYADQPEGRTPLPL